MQIECNWMVAHVMCLARRDRVELDVAVVSPQNFDIDFVPIRGHVTVMVREERGQHTFTRGGFQSHLEAAVDVRSPGAQLCAFEIFGEGEQREKQKGGE